MVEIFWQKTCEMSRNQKMNWNFLLKGALILLCQIISVECTTNFEYGATFSIGIYALNWFWFVFDLV